MEHDKFNAPHGIIVFGANGSGKTTLARELARILGYQHMDIEDYCFEQTEIPYTRERSRGNCLSLMLTDIQKYRSFVISAVTGDFGDPIPQFYELAVFVSAPAKLRMRRIEQRTRALHGSRVCEGGDMYEQHLRFMAFAAARPLEKIEEWAETLTCPILRIDGAEDWRKNAAFIAARFYASHPSSFPFPGRCTP